MNWKWFIILLLTALGLSIAVGLWYPASAADNVTTVPTTFVPLITTRVPTPVPTNPPIRLNPVKNSTSNGTIPFYVTQGDTVYIGQQIDISSIAQGIVNLAWYDGYDCYGDTQYLLPLPKTKAGYYNFYVDPSVFSSKLGVWCKWNGYLESNGNLKAFVVARAKPIQNVPLFNNTTLQNPNQTPLEVPRVPYLPVQHIADYLVARGDPLSVPAKGISDVWIFGARDSLLDYRSENGTINFTTEIIDTLSPGMYKILIHTQDISKDQKTVRYNNQSGTLQWFDPATFTIQGFSVTDQTPETVFTKLKQVYSSSDDKYQLFNLEVQMPTVTIAQIDSLNQLSDTSAPQAQGVTLLQQNYVDVRGYTNAAPGTIVSAVVDADFVLTDQKVWKDAYVTQTVGELAGDMREFKVLVPLNLLNMASCATGKCQHTVSVKTALSDAVISTAPFYVYDNPEGNTIPNKTIRYISGRYGPDEIVPTPTPRVVTQIVTQVVTQVVTVPVTPSNEQVLSQQRIAQKEISDQNWNRTVIYIVAGIAVIAFIVIAGWMISAWRRSKI